MVQACEGIGYAHRAGLVHCDVKPHNMLVTPDGRLKVTDFGIARALATIHPDEQSDVVWGSPQYFSPEQAAGQAPSPASDVYSLGVILYEMLAGQLPFTAERSGRTGPHAPRGPPGSAPALQPANHPRAGTDHPEGALQRAVAALPLRRPARTSAAQYLSSVPKPMPPRSPSTPVQPSFGHSAAARSRSVPSAAGTHTTRARLPGVRRPCRPGRVMQPLNEPEDHTLDIDWVTIFLGLLAALAVGGLIPFWLYIYLSINPPVR